MKKRNGCLQETGGFNEGPYAIELWWELRRGISLYEKHLGGKVLMMIRQDEAPGSTATKEAGKAVIHARLALGHTVLIGNDVPAPRFEKMRSVYIYLSVESTEEAERVYKVLSEDGQVYMPLSETFYATRFGQFRDRFGVSWSLIYERMEMQ